MLLLACLAGCRRWYPGNVGQPLALNGPTPGPPLATGQFLPNPLEVPVADREFFWNQLIDTVDDYFEIASERRAELSSEFPTEGLIETQYHPGSTVLEPWNWDSSSEYELAHATFQSIRRRARIQVVPTATGFGVNVEVFKELEDVARPAHGLPGAFTPRNDGSLLQRRRDPPRAAPTLGWIAIGRDTSLEQEILREFYGRLFDSTQPPSY
jgi:hypothetical protein